MEFIEGGGVEKYESFNVLAEDGWGDTGAPLKRSGKTELRSREKGLFDTCGVVMREGCHIEVEVVVVAVVVVE